GPYDAKVAGTPSTRGRPLVPDRPGGVLADHRPDHGRRGRGPLPDEVPKQVAGNRVLGEELPQSVKVDPSHVGSHETTCTTNVGSKPSGGRPLMARRSARELADICSVG